MKDEDGVDEGSISAELGDPAGQCNLGISYLQAKKKKKKKRN
ncbi:hypothetical protein HanIR_Chr08g0343691 [Helianthus annuus]|nr:hypothetical protein HanIR_Chr08g0343691 [Helianthus annuus]